MIVTVVYIDRERRTVFTRRVGQSLPASRATELIPLLASHLRPSRTSTRSRRLRDPATFASQRLRRTLRAGRRAKPFASTKIQEGSRREPNCRNWTLWAPIGNATTAGSSTSVAFDMVLILSISRPTANSLTSLTCEFPSPARVLEGRRASGCSRIILRIKQWEKCNLRLPSERRRDPHFDGQEHCPSTERRPSPCHATSEREVRVLAPGALEYGRCL